MDYRAAFQISAAGMSMERLRLDVTAMNVANMHSTASDPAGLYQPLRVVAHALPADFQEVFQTLASGQGGQRGLIDAEVVATAAPPRLVHDPAHPHADARGMVAFPGVDHTAEMLNLMTALRAYEANVAAAVASRTMAARALEIGGQS